MVRGPTPALARVAMPADDAGTDAPMRRKAHPDVGAAPDRSAGSRHDATT
jgi:hypothetical protein